MESSLWPFKGHVVVNLGHRRSEVSTDALSF